MLAEVDWSALAAAAPIAAPALLIGTIALLLNTSAWNWVVKRDIALDRNCSRTVPATCLSGLAGGAIGYTAISLSALNHTLAGGRRLPGLIVAALLVAHRMGRHVAGVVDPALPDGRASDLHRPWAAARVGRAGARHADARGVRHRACDLRRHRDRELPARRGGGAGRDHAAVRRELWPNRAGAVRAVGGGGSQPRRARLARARSG
jgi:hypothetical protein